ncbi:hypothetical protein K8S19_09200 [bacterium]|nr:hypothetical protein [bacterium]
MFGKHFYFLISIKIAMMVFVALFGVVNYLHAVDLFYDGFSGGIHGQQPANWQNHGIDIYYSLTDGYAIVDAGNDLGYVSRTILEFDVDLYNELYVRVSDVFLGGGTFQIGVRRGSVEYLLGEETSPGLYFFDIPTRTGLHGTQTLNVVIRINAFGWPIEESIVVDFVVVQGDFTYTFTPTNTATCTPTLTPTNSSTPTSIPSITPSSTLTISPSMTPSLILTATRTAISTLTLTPTSLTTILPSPSRTASVTHTPFHSLTSTRTSTSFERSATTTQTAKKELFFYMEQNRVWAYPNPA